MRTADLVVQTLKELDVEYIFSLSGNQIMPIYDALIGSGIELIHVRHEGAAVHMADAWGRLTGQPGVALVPAGPGFANTLSATYVAQMAESPLIVLSGHAPLETTGCGAFQELDQLSMAKPVSKAAWLVSNAAEVATAIQQAAHTASNGRMGPVHLALPFDLLTQEVNEKIKQPTIQIESTLPINSATKKSLIEAINQAKSPLILAGPTLARKESFHTASAMLSKAGLPLLPMQSPRGVNDPSLGNFQTILKQADLLVLLGQKLDFTLKFGQSQFFAPGVKLIQIDWDTAVLAQSKQNGAELSRMEFIHADPEKVLTKLAEWKTQIQINPDWLAEIESCLNAQPVIEQSAQPVKNGVLTPSDVASAINQFLAEQPDTVFISDGGEFGQWMQAFVNAPRRVINGKSGSIGSAIPFALAARLAFPDACIITCSGDGAFGFHPFEFETAVRYKLPFITVVGIDQRWNAEYQIQLREYGADRIFQVELDNTNYHEMVKAVGGWGERITTHTGLIKALHAAHHASQPACIDAIIHGIPAPQF